MRSRKLEKNHMKDWNVPKPERTWNVPETDGTDTLREQGKFEWNEVREK